jgi:hypothetical protein
VVLTYIAQHPDATKYELARNLRTKSYPNGVPYATVSMWIKSLEKGQEIVARKLGPTRAGLTKVGYKITPSAFFWISHAVDARQLLDLIWRHEKSLPIKAGLIERAITSTGNATGVAKAVSGLRIRNETSIDDHIAALVMNDLWDLEFDDHRVQRDFVVAIIRAVAEINADKIGRRDFVASTSRLIDEESRYLANAARTLGILKDEISSRGSERIHEA